MLKLDLWLITSNSWLFCLFLFKIVEFVLLSFAGASNDMIFYVLFVHVTAQCECIVLLFLYCFVFCSFVKTTIVA